jgi:hypothetical protein
VLAGTDAALTYFRPTSRSTLPSKMASCCSVHTQCGFRSSDTSSTCGTARNANTSSPYELLGGNCPTQHSRSQLLLCPSPSVVNHCNPDFHFRDLPFDNPLQTVKLCVTSAAGREAQSLISPGRDEDPFGWSPCVAARCKPTRMPIGTKTANHDTRRRCVTATSQPTQMNNTQPRPPRIQDPRHPDKRDRQVAQRTRGWAPRAKHTEA